METHKDSTLEPRNVVIKPADETLGVLGGER